MSEDQTSPIPVQQSAALIPDGPAWQIGRQFWLDREYAKAVQLFEEAERLLPLSGDDMHYYRRSVLEMGKADRAVDLLTRAESACSEPFWATFFLGRALRAAGRPLDGVAALGRAAEHARNEPGLLQYAFQELAGVVGTTSDGIDRT